jgi:NAD(P)-dependent dehydrogenase (short-subunit alcohol dehydrogenase family)
MWQWMLDLNAMSVVNAVERVVPATIAAGADYIVNVAPESNVRGRPGMAAYHVAKNTVVRLTESMAAELRGHGICVCRPTIIDTLQNQKAMLAPTARNERRRRRLPTSFFLWRRTRQ